MMSKTRKLLKREIEQLNRIIDDGGKYFRQKYFPCFSNKTKYTLFLDVFRR